MSSPNRRLRFTCFAAAALGLALTAASSTRAAAASPCGNSFYQIGNPQLIDVQITDSSGQVRRSPVLPRKQQGCELDNNLQDEGFTERCTLAPTLWTTPLVLTKGTHTLRVWSWSGEWRSSAPSSFVVR